MIISLEVMIDVGGLFFEYEGGESKVRKREKREVPSGAGGMSLTPCDGQV